MKKFLSIIIVLLVTGIGYAQDPGIPDTVNFGTCQSYIVADGDSLYGKVKVPLRVFNDEALNYILIYLKWNGPLLFDTLVFYGERGDSIDIGNFGFDNTERWILIQAITLNLSVMLPDTGQFLYMIFKACDTGLVKIDTFTAEGCVECPIWFSSPQDGWRPLFSAKEFQLVKSDTIPGDLNGNNNVNLSDAVILINYLFKNKYQGFLKSAADLNSDCEINLADIVYLENWFFRAAEKPKPGCAF